VTAQEQRAAAAAFAEKKRREKLARESAEAAAAEADARPRQAVGHEGKTRPAAAASSVPKSGQSSSARQLPSAQARLGAAAQELPAELMAGRGSERSLRSDGKQRPSDKAESGAGGAEKEAAELTQQQRKLAPPEMTIQTAPSPKQRAPSEAEAQTPLSATLAPPRTPSSASSRHSLNESVDDFGIFLSSSTGDFSNLQPDPQYWNTVTGYLEDADVHSTGIVSEFTATRIIQGLRLPVSEDTWRHAMALSSEHLVAAQGKRKGAAMPEPGVRYRELVSELEHMHELALRQQRIDAVLAAITHKSAAHLSAAIRSLPQSTLSDHSELEAALLAVLRDEPVSLPEHLVQTALELGSKGGELSAERLLNKLAKSVEKDPFGSVRKKLQDKYGLLKNAFQSIAHLPGGKKNAQGELEISMVQLRSALLGLGDDLSIEDTEQIVSLADADGSGSIDYKEFITMFSKSITAVRSRRTVMPARQRSTAQAPASERSGASSAFDPAEELMLRQLSESCWSLGEAFRALDKDGSGVIVCSELRGKLRDLGIDLSFNDMQRILAKVDANNDGSISYSEFVSRYRVQDVKSSAEAKSDTVMALSSAYQTPMQAYLAACGGDGASMLTRPRLKAFIRGLGLRLHAQTIDQLCNDVDGRVSAGADARTQQPLADFVPFVEFLRLFRCEPQAAPPDQASAAPSPLSRRFSASAASFLESDDSLLVQLEDALRERMRSAFGTLKSAFSSIDKVRPALRSSALRRPPALHQPLMPAWSTPTPHAPSGSSPSSSSPAPRCDGPASRPV
jgi:Ca2+-binding EF-hand superfamily protein